MVVKAVVAGKKEDRGNNMFPGPTGTGGASSGGGAGQSGTFVATGGAGGNGGAGGGAGVSQGGGGGFTGNEGANGGAGGAFGQGGTAAPFSQAIAAGNVGTSGHGGAINIQGVGAVSVSGTIASLGTVTGARGFTGLAYSGDSINASGTGGTVTIRVNNPAGGSTYFSDANYGQGANAYAAPLANLSVAGGVRTTAPDSITTVVGRSSQTYASDYVPSVSNSQSQTIKEGANSVLVGSGSQVTPAEWIAYLEVAAGGPAAQTIVLSQPASTMASGTGYASNGKFTVSTADIPATNFTNLILPADVIENVTALAATYTGTASIGGTLNTLGVQLNVGSTTTLATTGSINFTGGLGGVLTSGGAITGGGAITTSGLFSVLNLMTTSGSIYGSTATTGLNVSTPSIKVTAAGDAYLSDNRDVSLRASQTGGILSLVSTGNITVDGSVDSATKPGTTITLSGATGIAEGGTGGTLFATNATLNTNGGVIGTNSAHSIKTVATNLQVNTAGAGAVLLMTLLRLLLSSQLEVALSQALQQPNLAILAR